MQEPPALLVMSAAALYFVTTSDCKPHTRQHSLSFASRAHYRAAISHRILTLLRSSSSSSRSFSLSDILCLSVHTCDVNTHCRTSPTHSNLRAHLQDLARVQLAPPVQALLHSSSANSLPTLTIVPAKLLNPFAHFSLRSFGPQQLR